MADTDLITTGQLCATLGVCSVTVRRYVARGLLPPPVNPGSSKHLFRTETVRHYIKKMQDRAIRGAGAA